MTQSVLTPSAVPIPAVKIPLRELAPWFLFGGTLMLVLLYFVGTEQGAFAFFGGSYVHEFMHDGRHLLSFPCH